MAALLPEPFLFLLHGSYRLCGRSGPRRTIPFPIAGSCCPPPAAPLPRPRPDVRAAVKERAMRRRAKFANIPRRRTGTSRPQDRTPAHSPAFRRPGPRRSREECVRDWTPVQLQEVPAAGRVLPVLRPRAGVLLRGVQRELPEREAARGAVGGPLPSEGFFCRRNLKSGD